VEEEGVMGEAVGGMVVEGDTEEEEEEGDVVGAAGGRCCACVCIDVWV